MKDIDINIPNNETRKFQGNILKNGIKNINIQDTDLEKSYVRVSVNTGSINDPLEYQGLAHFLEHMLFLGSKKYPTEDEFDEFLNQNGGMSNAYTDTYQTVYQFNIYNDKLEKALDMFSRFFIDPLFNEDSVNREINAIHSEHEKNIQADNWRIFHFIGMTSKKDSMINKFGTGNLKSLNKPGVRDAMIQFYNKYYVSSNLCIAIVSSLELDLLDKYVDNSFSKIKKSDKVETIVNKPFFDSSIQSNFIKSVDKTNLMVLYWEIPEHSNNYLFTHSNYILANVINSKNSDSLKNFLIKKGLIRELFSLCSNEGIFEIFVELIDMKYWKKVVSYLKYYFEELSNKDLNKICQYAKKKDEITYSFSEKKDSEDLVDSLVVDLNYYDIEDSYYKSYVITKIDTKQMKDLITDYLSFDKVKMLLVSDKKENLDKDIKVGETIRETFYKFEYNKLDLADVIRQITPEKFDFKIITDNPFLDVNPKILKLKNKSDIPHLMKLDNVSSKIWFGSNFKFNESVVYSNITFINPFFTSSLEDYLYSSIFLTLFSKKAGFEFSLAQEIGFKIYTNFNNLKSLINIQIFGYNDKFKEFFNLVVTYLRDLKLDNNDDVIIDGIVSGYIEQYQNIFTQNPWQLSSYLIDQNVNLFPYASDTVLEFLKNFTLENFKSKFKKVKEEILKNSKVLCFFYGNISEEMLFEKENIKLDLFQSQEKNELNIREITTIDIIHPNKNETDNFVQYSYYMGKFNPVNNLLLLILKNSISHNFFDSLRTKQQFGYLVASGMSLIENDYYFIQKIQSKKQISSIKKAIDEFNKSFLSIINEENFNKFLEASINILKEPDNNTKEVYFRYKREIANEDYLFSRNDLLLNQVKNINYELFKEFFTKNILNVKPVELIIKGN